MRAIFKPPAAEKILKHEEAYPHQEAVSDAEMSMQTEPPVVIEERTHYTLGDIVGHAHAPVWYNPVEQRLTTCAVIKIKHSRHQYEHK